MPDQHSNRIAKIAREARAGVAGQNARSVLMASLVGAILVMIVIAAISFG
jgi:hypothetical protein